MATSTRVTVSGLKELQAELRKLGDDMTKKIARQATGAAAQVIKARAKLLAPVAPEPYVATGSEGVKTKVKFLGKTIRGKSLVAGGVLVEPGNIGKNIISKWIGKRTSLTSAHIVTVRGKKKYGYASRIAALQEFGTVTSPAQPFLRPAFEQEKGFAVAAMVKKIKQRIDKAGKK